MIPRFAEGAGVGVGAGAAVGEGAAVVAGGAVVVGVTVVVVVVEVVAVDSMNGPAAPCGSRWLGDAGDEESSVASPVSAEMSEGSGVGVPRVAAAVLSAPAVTAGAVSPSFIAAKPKARHATAVTARASWRKVRRRVDSGMGRLLQTGG